MTDTALRLRCQHLVTHEHGVLDDAVLVIAHAEIIGIEAAGSPATEEIAGWVVPGFVDTHVHGGGGASYATDDPAEARRARQFHREHGTTSTLASLVTTDLDTLAAQIATLRPLVADGEFAGIHLEGPFLSEKRKGAHDPTLLRDPEPTMITRLIEQAGGTVEMITVAPELTGGLASIEAMVAAGAIAAVGHTDADDATVAAALDAGATVVTHLFNAMPSIHHREPGPIPRLLSDDRCMVELIADGFHLHPRVIEMAVSAAGPDRVALVTDAMAAAGMPDGDFDLGTLHVAVRDCAGPTGGTGRESRLDRRLDPHHGRGLRADGRPRLPDSRGRDHGGDHPGPLARAGHCRRAGPRLPGGPLRGGGSWAAAARHAGRHLDRRQREREHLMLAGLREVLDPAVDAGTGIGAFNVICLEHAEAVIWGAEAANLPVVLQVSENAVLYHRSLEPILIATVALARNADIPAVVHLDHVTDPDLVRAGVELGATSVMFDGSRRSYEENVAVTADVVRYCHARNVQVEAELGEVGGKDGVHSSTARTRPEDATVFVDDTEVDALAVAVGSSHAMTERTTSLDLELVERLRGPWTSRWCCTGPPGCPTTSWSAPSAPG